MHKLPANYEELSRAERREVRNAYVEKQNGLCYWCECPLDLKPPPEITNIELNMSLFPPNMLDYPVHLQHCHETGMTEGAVHAYCNCVMWQHHGR
jgi:hypothetical protein